MAEKKPNYAFIDSQNLNLGVRSQRWRLDYRKFRLYLKNKHNVQKAFLFIGMVAGNQKLYSELQSAGFVLVFKPTVRYFENGKETVKGNVDAELVLHAAAVEYSSYEQAIVVTGDGDFACLIDYLDDNKKFKLLIAPNKKYSQLLKHHAPNIMTIDKIKTSVQKQKSRHRRSVETLGLSGNGDRGNVAKKSKKVNTGNIVKQRYNGGDK